MTSKEAYRKACMWCRALISGVVPPEDFAVAQKLFYKHGFKEIFKHAEELYKVDEFLSACEM